MPNTERFEYVIGDPLLGDTSLVPRLPMTLRFRNTEIRTNALLDTGSTVNVLPFLLGKALGAQWEEFGQNIKLTGNLAYYEARPLIVSATIGSFAPKRLIFAWTQTENAPLLLGQVNFFDAFHVCFFRSERYFELTSIS
jgi:hypothetical protein